MNYVTSCPSCGQQLQPHAGNTQSPPWICNSDHLMFWVCEIQPEARAKYLGKLDWGYGAHIQPLQIARLTEYHEAVKRGTSAREDQLSILSIDQLKHLKARKKVDPEFMKKVEAEHGRRGVK